MVASGGDFPDEATAAKPDARRGLLRRLPIRWRILLVAVLNTLAVGVCGLVVAQGSVQLSAAWSDLQGARQTARWLLTIRSDVDRFQALVHRYLTHPTVPVLEEIDTRRSALFRALNQAGQGSSGIDRTELALTVHRLFLGFDELRQSRAALVNGYEQDILRPVQEMIAIYTLLEGNTQQESPMRPLLSMSREVFNAGVVAATSFYLSRDEKAAEDARRSLNFVEATSRAMLEAAEDDVQAGAGRALHARAAQTLRGFESLTSGYASQSDLLRVAVDENQDAMLGVIDRLSRATKASEEAVQRRFNDAVRTVFIEVSLTGAIFSLISVLVSVRAARSISKPLSHLRDAMTAIAAGRLGRPIPDLEERDEVGDMARAVRVFRDDMVTKRQAEDDLRTSTAEAERAVAVLRDAQASLVESEKLAALGSLVAGVAHEVNSPVGVSLTVASSLAGRCTVMEGAAAQGPLRRSQFEAFLKDNRDAANQLVANLERAAELVHAFKQVAVDRSHAERRPFDLAETTNQLVASLLPAVRKQRVAVEVNIEPGVVVESYPGAYGQVLTNLVLNSLMHGFADADEGTIRITAERRGDEGVAVSVVDDGRGMPEEVRLRVFEPFFTTRRGQGGTGLGLNIVHNLVTQQLGGSIIVTSVPWEGARFTLVFPRTGPAGPDVVCRQQGQAA